MNQKLKDEVWKILVEECGAHEEPMGDWIHWPDCREYRFCGALGFGGKVWHSEVRWTDPCPVYVTCYPEDMTPERKAMIEKANARLKDIVPATVHPWCQTAFEQGIKDPDEYPCDDCREALVKATV
jgi:hypothetical protein